MFHNDPFVISKKFVDIDTALVAIAKEPVFELFNLNWNDELTPVVLGNNLKSQSVSFPLPLDLNNVCVFVVVSCFYTNSNVFGFALSIHQSVFKILALSFEKLYVKNLSFLVSNETFPIDCTKLVLFVVVPIVGVIGYIGT